MSNFLNNANKNWSVVAGQIQNQAANGVVYIKPSAFQIPVGVSNERPTGEAGMIRYLTTENIIEYYNANSGVWLPISQQPPEITSISPTQLSDPSAGQSQTFTITGSNFASGCFVEFIGQNLTIYGDDQTNFINETSIQALFNANNSIYDASFNEPFTVRVSNPSGLAITLTDAVVYNERPTFTNAVNLGSLDSSQNVFGLLADLTGIDPDSHYPLIFDVSNGSTLPGTIDLSNDTTANAGVGKGFFLGNAPIITNASTTYNPYFVITDASNNTSFFERFNFTVRGPLNLRTSTAITSGGTIDISYTDSTGTNYINDPSYGGYTIYTFKASSNTTNAIFTFEPNNWSDIAECLIVGGGGGGGSCAAGGGAGGFVNDNFYFQNGYLYDIQVGGGGLGGAAGDDNAGANGGTSFIGTSTYKLNAFGGGGGAALQQIVGGFGGSGGGGGYDIDQGGKSKASAGATTTLLQGFDGGDGNNELGGGNYPGGGGGGAGGPGGFVTSSSIGPNGGFGLFSSITGVNTGYAGGGGASTLGGGTAGFGGGGSSNPYGAADGRANSNSVGNSATPHTGSGGGAGSSTDLGSSTRSGGGAGGSGIVVIKIPSYPLNLGENRLALSNSSLTYDIYYVDNAGSYTSSPQIDGETIYTFKEGSGTITPNFTLDCSYLVVAGGGGGGTSQIEDRAAGGGGAGGLKFGVIPVANNVAFTVEVGAGGVGGVYQVPNGTFAGNASNGANSIINGILTTGGGYGAGVSGTPSGGSGGSGGGGRNSGGGGSGVSGEGNSGGSGSNPGGGGGGYAGSGGKGGGGEGNPNGGAGGNGHLDSITGNSVTYAAGGGGGGQGSSGIGGSSQGGGSGANGYSSSSNINDSIAGIPNKNTGSGGGGRSSLFINTNKRGNSGSNGANGAVILRFLSFGSLPTLNSLQISATNGTADILYVNSSNTVVNSPVSGGYTIYSFTCTSNLTTATFTVTSNFTSSMEYLVIGGGGGGGPGWNGGGGGGGAGGYRSSVVGESSGGGASAEALLNVISGVSLSVTVGAGGAGGTASTSGTNSILGSIISDGGGAGSPATASDGTNGLSGGSGGGGGAGQLSSNVGFGGAGTVGQGRSGGNSANNSTDSWSGGGGGGASIAGGNAISSTGGGGGHGVPSSITGVSVIRAGGGGGFGRFTAGVGGSGGGGSGGAGGDAPRSSGTANTGSGGGGGTGTSGLGGSGIIIVRFPSFA